MAGMTLFRKLTKEATVVAKKPSYSSRIGSSRQMHSEELRYEDFSPKAWEAIGESERVAYEWELKCLKPECLMLALLRQKGRGIAKDVLEKACDVKLFEDSMVDWLLIQKCTQFGFWELISADRHYMGRPINCLNPLLVQAKKDMIKMKDTMVREQHLLSAYSKDKIGKIVFSNLNVQENHLTFGAPVQK